VLIVTDLYRYDAVSRTKTTGVSLPLEAAWELTRRISPRDEVRVMVREADGQLHANAYPRLYRLGPAAPVTPWCIRLADARGQFRLLCFDFDAKDGDDAAERAIDDCEALSKVLGSLSIAHVVCQSSAGGGRHLWVGIRDAAAGDLVGRVATAARANFRTLDHGMLLNSKEGAARPPGAPHRDGSASRILRGRIESLTDPTTTAGDLSQLVVALISAAPELRAEDSSPSGPVDAAHTAHRRLSKSGEAHMATIRGGSNPSWTGFMCLLSAASAGWALRDVEHAARTAPGMEHFRTKNTGRGTRRPRSTAEASSRLERQWAKAQEIASLHRVLPPAREPRDLSELEAIVTDVDDLLQRFRINAGRWGNTEAAASQRTILTALAYLTLHTGKRVVAASIRDLALLAGLGRTTSATALHALTEAGFIEPVRSHDGANAAEWKLTPNLSTGTDRVRSQPLKNPRPPTELFMLRTALVDILEAQLTDQRHDLFTRAGHGHLAGRLYAVLKNRDSVSVDSAAQLLGVSIRHATTVLSRLRHSKLVVKTANGWVRAKQDLRNQAARLLGVFGVLRDRGERYAAEREVWAWWQAEFATMTAPPGSRPRRAHVTSRPIFESSSPGERIWPRYPRNNEGLGDHKQARQYVDDGVLSPTSRWQLSDVA
jgi:DNA-binding IscR family transcriptional regulator